MNELAIVILNYNSSGDTIKCVNQLLSFQDNFHIIIVDNKSTDNSLEVLKEQLDNNQVTIIENGVNNGYNAGNNVGMRYAIESLNCKYIGIMNPDIIIPNKEIFYEAINALNSNDLYALIGASTLDINGNFDPNCSGWDILSPLGIVYNHILSHKKKNTTFKTINEDLVEVDCVVGCFFIIKSSIVEEIGYFDENVFLYNEENLLGNDLKRRGYKELVLRNYYYYHNHKNTPNSSLTFKQKVYKTKPGYESRKYLCKKYYPKYTLPLLWIAEKINQCHLFLAYFKNKLPKG